MRISADTLTEEDANYLLTATIAPRPIAWISSASTRGEVNLAPFSAFAPICNRPPTIVFSAGKKPNGMRKDTVLNVLSSKEFVINFLEEPLLHKMAQTTEDLLSQGNEIRLVGLTPIQS